jgi:hypothetical protein
VRRDHYERWAVAPGGDRLSAAKARRDAIHMALAWCGSLPDVRNSKWGAGNLETGRS